MWNWCKRTHLVTGKCIGIIYSVVHLFFLQVNSFQGIYIHTFRGPYLLYKLDVVILASVPFTGIHLMGCCALAKGCHIFWAEFNFVVHGTSVRWARLCCGINGNHPNVSFIGLNTSSVLCACVFNFQPLTFVIDTQLHFHYLLDCSLNKISAHVSANRWAIAGRQWPTT